MSKKVKGLITNELTAKLKALDTVAVISPRGIDGIKNNLLRRRLREKGLRMTVVKNSLAKRATVGTKIAGFEKLLDGPSAVIHGNLSIAAIARFLLDEKKKDEKLEIHGLYFDGELYQGEKGIEQASKLPTREEAIGNLVGMILGPGRKLAGSIKGPGGRLGAILKTIEEKAKEKEKTA
jgi:large subunit ribosomal protein L10